MDELSGFLEGPLAQPPTMFRCAFSAPWSVRVDDGATIGLVAVARGRTWLVAEDGHPVAVRAGDVALVRGPSSYTLTDDPEGPVRHAVWAGSRWSTGTDAGEVSALSLRPWGQDPGASTTLVVGSYDAEGEISRRLVEALPGYLLVPARDLDSPLVTLLDDEAAGGAPGQVAMAERLLDLLVLTALRAWFRRPESNAPVWYEAYEDPMVAATLRALHADPARAWSVEAMAEEVGGTRTTLARRFTDMVGETPMAYLARWRLNLAADLFWSTDFGLAEVAERVGYGTVYSLSTAFKRVHGINPSQHRKAGRARAAAKAAAAGGGGEPAPPPDGDAPDDDADG